MNNGKINIGLINPKSPENVDSVMRAAGNYQVDRIFYTGKRYLRALEYKNRRMAIARKMGENISVQQLDDLLVQVPQQMQVVCVELVINATSLPEYQHPEQGFYIFGPEDGSIPQDVIDQADAVVYVPTVGCMNLAATVNVVLYDRIAKLSSIQAGNDLIQASRDINNRLCVRK